MLENVCFEGASKTCMLDNLVRSHSESSITITDTFAGRMEHQKTVDQLTSAISVL